MVRMTDEIIDDSQFFQQQLFKHYNSEDMSDVQIKVGGKTFNSHKLVLIMQSDVFKTMLTGGNWPESRYRRVVLNEEPECVDIFENFLKYLYGGRIVLTNSSVLAILMLADKYNIKHLSESCSKYMCKYCLPVSEPYLISWLQYAILTDMKELEGICRRYITWNFEAITEKKEFLMMTDSLLLSFLKSSDLVISSELTLYKAAHRWLNFQPSSAYRDLFIKLMIHIRFPMMQLSELPSLEKDCFIEKFKDFYLHMVFLSIRYHTCETKEERESLIDCRINKRLFYPRNYTSGTWGTTMCVERFSQLAAGEVRGAFFTTPISASEKNQHEFSDWHLHLYPKGVLFNSGIMIYVPKNLTVNGELFRNVRLSISGVFSEKVHVQICVLIMTERGDGSGQDYVFDAIMKDALFDKDVTHFNINDIVPYRRLNMLNSVYLGQNDTFKITVLIKPEFHYRL